MAPKKRTKLEAGSSSQEFDGRIFANPAAHARYQRLSTKVVIQDRGLECNAESYRHDPQYDEIRRSIITRGWQLFVNVNEESNISLSLEFLENWKERENGVVMVRRKKIAVTPEVINMMYRVSDYTDEEEQLLAEEREGSNWARFSQVLGYDGYHIHDNRIMLRKELNWVAKAWSIFVSARFLPTKNLSHVEYNRLRYIYAIRRGHKIDLGKMIVNSLDTITQNYYSEGVGMVGIITQIC